MVTKDPIFDRIPYLLKDTPRLLSSHGDWLRGGGNQLRLRKWNERLSADPEAAICEARVRAVLIEHEVSVESAENLSTGGVDFVCQSEGSRFYVEVTCLKIQTATKASWMEHTIDSPGGSVGTISGEIRRISASKTAQCSRVDDAPCLLAIATLHHPVSVVCFSRSHLEDVLISPTFLTFTPAVLPGEIPTDLRLATNLHSSVFVRPAMGDVQQIEPARQPLSGLLLMGFGCWPHQIRGVLNNDAIRPFDRHILRDVEFARLAHGYKNGAFAVEWV